jgi:hypothetical protein
LPSESLAFEGAHRATAFDQGVTGLNPLAVSDFSKVPGELHEQGKPLQSNRLVAML